MQTYAFVRRNMENAWIAIGNAAKTLNISRDTLRRWEKRGLIHSYRSPTGRRYYNLEELKYVFAKKPSFVKPSVPAVAEKETQVSAVSKTEESSISPKNLIYTKNLLVLFSFLISLYIILLIFFLLQPILLQTPLSPVP